MSQSEPRKLRVGLLVDSRRVPAWAHAMLERIAAGDYAEVVLVVETRRAEPPRRVGLRHLRNTFRRLLYDALTRLDRKLRPVRPDAFAVKDLSDVTAGAQTWVAVPDAIGPADSFAPHDIERIAACELDVLVRLGSRLVRGGVLQAARYGVWSYQHGDRDVNRGGPAGAWEVLEDSPVTGAIVQILTEDLDSAPVLYRSWSRTDPLSIAANRNALYWRSVAFLPRKLEELHRRGGEAFMRDVHAANAAPAFYSRRLYATPRNRELLRLAFRKFAKALATRLRNLFWFEQWILLYARERVPGSPLSLCRLQKVVPPRDRFWADPFVVSEEGTEYVFVEELLYETNRGRIACATVDESGKWSAPRVVLERPYHLSYPYIFQHRGTYYMLPETSENRTVELYRCIDWPGEWRLERVLMRGVTAVDSTLHHHEGKWWLFTAMREYSGVIGSDELFLFSSHDLLEGPWRPHPMNPVISDARGARPAGRIFSYGGDLYRPSQIGAPRYGSGVAINRIDTLTETEYREVRVAGFEAQWDPAIDGTHTFNFSSGLAVADARLWRWRFGNAGGSLPR